MSDSRQFHCPTCNHQSSIYVHRVTPGIINALVKFKRAVIEKGTYTLHTRKDLDGTPHELSKGEYANWTMLRYHALVAHARIRTASGELKIRKGYWTLTTRGNQFLKGEITIPARVEVLNNRVIGHDMAQVHVRDVLGKQPYFEEVETIERTRQVVNPQLGLAL